MVRDRAFIFHVLVCINCCKIVFFTSKVKVKYQGHLYNKGIFWGCISVSQTQLVKGSVSVFIAS